MSNQVQLHSGDLKKIKHVVQRFLFHEHGISVFIFGSRVSSKASSVSDIDIGLLTQKNVPAEFIQDFRDSLENLPIFYKFDVVDFSKTSKGFRKHALKNIFPLN